MKYISILLSLLVGCSAFQPKQQHLTINGYPQKVFVNGTPENIPTIINIDRDKSVTINKFNDKGYLTFTKTISPVQSVWGKLDTWGVYFLYPGIGLFTPGAYQLETDNIVVK